MIRNWLACGRVLFHDFFPLMLPALCVHVCVCVYFFNRVGTNMFVNFTVDE